MNMELKNVTPRELANFFLGAVRCTVHHVYEFSSEVDFFEEVFYRFEDAEMLEIEEATRKALEVLEADGVLSLNRENGVISWRQD